MSVRHIIYMYSGEPSLVPTFVRCRTAEEWSQHQSVAANNHLLDSCIKLVRSDDEGWFEIDHIEGRLVLLHPVDSGVIGKCFAVCICLHSNPIGRTRTRNDVGFCVSVQQVFIYLRAWIASTCEDSILFFGAAASNHSRGRSDHNALDPGSFVGTLKNIQRCVDGRVDNISFSIVCLTTSISSYVSD